MNVAVHRLGEFIEVCNKRNSDLRLGVTAVRGISNEKSVIATKADMSGVSLAPYKLFKPNEFCFVTITSRNGSRISLACNETNENFIVSSSYEVFRIVDKRLMPEYLAMLFRRTEFDRYARFHSWGSAREAFSFADMQRVELPIPPIEEQRKAVEVWQGLRKMKEENEQLAEPLMQLCRSYLEECKKKWPLVELGPMIHLMDETNVSRKELSVVGVNFQKEFMPTAANMDGIDTTKYKVMTKSRFVFSGMQTGRDACIRIGLWNDEVDALMSPAYSTFEVCDARLLPEYLFLWFKRGEVDRLGWFYSDSSVRANLDWNRFCAIKIPLPPLDVQQAIVDVYRCASEAKKIAAEADGLSRAVCPALVRGAGETAPTERRNTPQEG